MSNLTFLYFSSPAYESRAKVLTDSIKKYHPEALIVGVEIDNTNNLYPSNLAKKRFERVLQLIQDGHSKVILIGADCELFYKISSMLNYLKDSRCVLVPHVKTPIKDREFLKGLYQVGHINGDLIGFSEDSIEILKWLISVSQDDSEPGAFYEQTWLSSLPFLFYGVHVLRHEGYNVAYWNVNHIEFNQDFIDYKLRVFHYSGYEKGKAEQMSKHSTETCSGEILEFYKNYDRRI
jgi:hypothetical protein